MNWLWFVLGAYVCAGACVNYTLVANADAFANLFKRATRVLPGFGETRVGRLFQAPNKEKAAEVAPALKHPSRASLYLIALWPLVTVQMCVIYALIRAREHSLDDAFEESWNNRRKRAQEMLDLTFEEVDRDELQLLEDFISAVRVGSAPEKVRRTGEGDVVAGEGAAQLPDLYDSLDMYGGPVARSVIFQSQEREVCGVFRIQREAFISSAENAENTCTSFVEARMLVPRDGKKTMDESMAGGTRSIIVSDLAFSQCTAADADLPASVNAPPHWHVELLHTDARDEEESRLCADIVTDVLRKLNAEAHAFRDRFKDQPGASA